MYDLNQVIKGIRQYLESEMVNRISGIEKWVVGAGLSMLLDNGVNTFNALTENPLVQSMQIVNSDNEIDVDKLYKYFMEEARKSAVTFKAPLLGAITLKAEDIEKVYSYIKESK